MTIKREVEVELTVDEAAEFFAHLSDDKMCAFLNRVAEIAYGWDANTQIQWLNLGDRLREEGTNDAREMVRDWVLFMDQLGEEETR